MEEYLLTFDDFTKDIPVKNVLVKCKDDDDAIKHIREIFNIKGGKIDKKSGYITPKNREWLASFTPVSLLSKTALKNIFDPKYQWSIKYGKTLYNLQERLNRRKRL